MRNRTGIATGSYSKIFLLLSCNICSKTEMHKVIDKIDMNDMIDMIDKN